MKSFQLSYGEEQLHIQIPKKNFLSVLDIADSIEASSEDSTHIEPSIEEALAFPTGSAPLKELVKPDQKVCIITSDLTRPCPSSALLPPILAELSVAGVPDENISIVIALGLHRPMTKQEMISSLGTKICDRFQVINHNPQDTRRIGTTQRGTPVEIFSPVVESDFRICLGNVEFHYFAGYSGGAKAILPGCASKAAITANHAMMTQAAAAAGKLEGNPVREDLEEAVNILGVDFILNVIVDSHHRIQGAFAGDPTAAHRKACQVVASRGMVPIEQLADIVLVSAGGFPKDINLYQAQKALDNAAYAVRDGGAVILVAECREGYGNQTFETWMRKACLPELVLEDIQKEFVLGGHKAAAIAAILTRARIYLVSSMPEEAVRNCNMEPCRPQDLSTLLEELANYGRKKPMFAIMPHGGSTLPVLK